ncbi:uncharacterized protein LOC113751338 [Coffea eugenioides]|uniref:uncharacterized protein LOC113751338 n=1 Tax=Coffea eugenioides TaxID=49369 RepID=UPI000F60BAD2|nr:uncharacterized protein LOC113751338 [Coffea eugenioides]
MDKTWMKISNRKDKAYELGVKSFLKFAYSQKVENQKIPCPCTQCNNFCNQTKTVVEDHLLTQGIRKSYTRWIHHGEQFRHQNCGDSTKHGDGEEDSDTEDLNDMLHDIGTAQWGDNWAGREESTDDSLNANHSDTDNFLKLLEDAKKELYPGNHFYSKLSFVVTLLHLKTMSGWTIKSFNALLEIFRHALPPEATVPKSFADAKKLIRDLGFKSKKIHACVNDCVLFRKENENFDTCPNLNCKEPRYKMAGSRVPRKVLRYFPLKPRLQRLYTHKEIASDMRWHKEKCVHDDNIMRHPADSEAWKHFDRLHPDFAVDPRNVRLGLATDGFNPFGTMISAYSIWPIYLVPYNLPPWKCMRDPFFFLSMLIPGPKSPGNEIDVYMEPLIDELNEMWLGVETYDAYSGKKFDLRAALLWTINDFPAYAMLSGWSTKRYQACPICMVETTCVHLPHRKKLCYTGHRRFLPIDHSWRREKKPFDGNVDFRNPVAPLSGNEILDQVQNMEVNFGKTKAQSNAKKRKRSESGLNWTKKSCFFELPYWADLLLRHNLDLMHVSKNVSEAVIATIMDIENKTKDHWLCRQDLKDLGLKKELHLIPNGDSYIMPHACYSLTKEEKKKVCEFLNSVKYPDGFASNICRCIKNGQFQISGMKSHDFHIFIQRLLPLAIRGSLTKEVRQVLFELSEFFKKLCARTLHREVLEELGQKIAVILCKLERLFPPAFFDIMMHLMVHLPAEAILGGPAQYRWMFPFER